jgi:DNA (cytosine-5)-methyltransferase 3A
MEKEQLNLFDYVSSQGVQVLSLFDGMACGMLAMLESGIKVDRYVAYEIDKYAVQTSTHNFPMIEQRGDVFKADFTEFKGFDYLIGGSPCTYWSIAQKNNRETEASGMGWELFSQYVRALHEAKPKYFVYENNKSMSKAIRASIDEAFGFEAVYINSALVSAQNRQRLYWVGRRNEDGTYSKVDIKQPEDRGILLRDVLEGAKPINVTADGEKARTLMAGYYKYGTATLITNKGFAGGTTAVAEPVAALGEQTDIVPFVEEKIPKAIEKYGYLPTMWNPYNNAEITDKAPTLTTGCNSQTTSATVMVVCCVVPDCNMVVKEATKKGYTEIKPMDCVDMTQPNSKTRRGRNMANKSNCLMTSCQYYQYCGVLVYATPCEWDENGKPTKAISAADGKIYDVYEVKGGYITIKGKSYPIKLVDGFYIIRKLTVKECMRLQTVPEWYEFPVSDSQAYKMLGNGWTVSVISWLLNATKEKER